MHPLSESQIKINDEIIIIPKGKLAYEVRKGNYTLILLHDEKELIEQGVPVWFDEINIAGDQINELSKRGTQTKNFANGQVINRQHNFLIKITQIVKERLDDHLLSIDDLCKMLHLSYMQFYRQLKSLTGKTPVQFIRSIRLEEGRLKLESTQLKISEIAYSVGFSDPNYFSRAFYREFGKSPRSYRQ